MLAFVGVVNVFVGFEEGLHDFSIRICVEISGSDSHSTVFHFVSFRVELWILLLDVWVGAGSSW